MSTLKVFVSWSGKPSQQCALLLREILPAFNTLIEPFVSSEDIAKGDRGFDVIAGRLAGSRFGIVCVTPENRRTPWISFEAGALSKELGGPRLAPLLLFGTTVADLVGTPLTQFQATTADAPQEVLHLIKTVNGLCEVPQKDQVIEELFEMYWPKLHEGLARIAPEAEAAEGADGSADKPSAEDIQNQMLSLLLRQADQITDLERLVRTIARMNTFEQVVAEVGAERANDLRRSGILFDGMFPDLGQRDSDGGRDGRAQPR
ncbi:hypothetical protein [Streptomyces sp. NPDC001137]|uniref:hypothetical protein n=1 Tax=Streptomyces sp. NPDC001137 TaxID=3154378 RepID=UPI0033259DC0